MFYIFKGDTSHMFPDTLHKPTRYIHDVHVADSKLCIAVCNSVVVFLKDFLSFHQ